MKHNIHVYLLYLLSLSNVIYHIFQYAEGLDRGMAAVKAAREFSSNLDRLFNETLTELKEDQDRLYNMRLVVSNLLELD